MPRKLTILALTSVLIGLAAASPASAVIKTEAFEYKDGDTVLEGFIAYDDATTARRPGVLIWPSWVGPTDHERDAAKKLAELGFVAFAADPYGRGVRPTPPKESAAEMVKYMADRPMFRRRVAAALEVLSRNPMVDQAKLASIGYCFGGAAVLELARSGAGIVSNVVFHGSLSSPTPADAKNIKGKVLVLHGADDPAVPAAEVDAFKKEMKDAKIDMQLVLYPDTVHSYTMPRAGNDNSRGSAYNEASARRSWIAMQAFFKETLGM